LRILFFLILNHAVLLMAQPTITVALPDAFITADRVLRGDADTYGLGDWQATFTATIDGSQILLTGTISFTENANDFTTIVGRFIKVINIEALEGCSHCQVVVDGGQGTVSGPNIGARGYRWFEGKGLIKRAWIQTDTFGADTGNIGGTIQFEPLEIRVYCAIAQYNDR
jgi:hypothetical protein